MPSLIFHFALVESHGGSYVGILNMTTDSTDFRVQIRHCIRPSYAYTWEIYSVRVLKCIKRSYRSYPTRGVAMKAGKKALLRMIASSHGHLVAKPQRESRGRQIQPVGMIEP